jgi:DNA-binding NarL/FixJ family response regulator
MANNGPSYLTFTSENRFLNDPVLDMHGISNISAIYPKSPVLNMSRNESFNDISDMHRMSFRNQGRISKGINFTPFAEAMNTTLDNN